MERRKRRTPNVQRRRSNSEREGCSGACPHARGKTLRLGKAAATPPARKFISLVERRLFYDGNG
jgi:hypothetical protein